MGEDQGNIIPTGIASSQTDASITPTVKTSTEFITEWEDSNNPYVRDLLAKWEQDYVISKNNIEELDTKLTTLSTLFAQALLWHVPEQVDIMIKTTKEKGILTDEELTGFTKLREGVVAGDWLAITEALVLAASDNETKETNIDDNLKKGLISQEQADNLKLRYRLGPIKDTNQGYMDITTKALQGTTKRIEPTLPQKDK